MSKIPSEEFFQFTKEAELNRRRELLKLLNSSEEQEKPKNADELLARIKRILSRAKAVK